MNEAQHGLVTVIIGRAAVCVCVCILTVYECVDVFDVVESQSKQRRVERQVSTPVVAHEEDLRVVLPRRRAADPRVADPADHDQCPTGTTTARAGQVRPGRAGDHPVALDDALDGDDGAASSGVQVADCAGEDGVGVPLAYLPSTSSSSLTSLNTMPLAASNTGRTILPISHRPPRHDQTVLSCLAWWCE